MAFSPISRPSDLPILLEHWMKYQRLSPSLCSYCKPTKMDQCLGWSLDPSEINGKISIDFNRVKISSSASSFPCLRGKLFLKPPCQASYLFIKQRCQSVLLHSLQTYSHWVILPSKGPLSWDTRGSSFINKGEPAIKRSAPSRFWKPSILQSRTYLSRIGGSTAFNSPVYFIALLSRMTLF